MYFHDQTIFRFRGPWGIPCEVGCSALFLLLVVLEFGKPVNLFVFDLMFLGLLFLSIFLHEVGHAWGARIQGIPISRIALNGAGGYCVRGAEATPYQRELIVIMGPLTNLAIWALASLIAPLVADPETAWVFAALAWINLYLAIFNLVPVMPLDGGRLLYLLLQRVMSEPRAERVTGLIGLGVALVWVPVLLLGFAMTGLILFFLPSIPDHWKMLRGTGTGAA